MPNQEHSKAIWRERSGSGIVLDAVPMYLRYDGADVVFSATSPAQLAFIRVVAPDVVLLDLAPRYIVFDGSDLVIGAVGPAVAVLADDGFGGIELTTDLSRAPIADLLADGAGNVWAVLRSADRLEAVTVAGNIHLY